VAPNEDYSALIVDLIDEQLARTAHKWGYTIQKKESGEWIYWQIAEFSPYEVITAHRCISYTHLSGIANDVCCNYYSSSPEELRETISVFVRRVLEQVIVVLAWKELRKVLHGAKAVGLMNSKIFVEIDPDTFYIKFRLGDIEWSWEVTSEDGRPVAVVRQPLCEYPIRALMEIAKCFAIALI
jgi:hypothetical protein